MIYNMNLGAPYIMIYSNFRVEISSPPPQWNITWNPSIKQILKNVLVEGSKAPTSCCSASLTPNYTQGISVKLQLGVTELVGLRLKRLQRDFFPHDVIHFYKHQQRLWHIYPSPLLSKHTASCLYRISAMTTTFFLSFSDYSHHSNPGPFYCLLDNYQCMTQVILFFLF